MKRASAVTGVLVVIGALAGEARAQLGTPSPEEKYFRVPHKYQLFVDGSGALPSSPGEFNDYWNSSFQFGAGGGYTLFPWLDLKAVFTYASWDNNAIESKKAIGYTGLQEVEGGKITTMTISGSARFLAVPSARTNPFLEVSVGYYTTSADDLFIEGVLENSMEDANGLVVGPGAGIQYAMSDSWSTYVKYTYMLCVSDTFAPGDLLEPEGGGEPVDGQNEVYQTIGVGVMLRF